MQDCRLLTMETGDASFIANIVASALFRYLSLRGSTRATQPQRTRETGTVTFPISCAPAVRVEFDRGVALLHSFAYGAAKDAFQGVAEQDPRCAMAHWGIAMTYFHQVWDPPLELATIPAAQKEIRRAQQIGAGSERERQFIHALGLIYQDAATVPYGTRALQYEHAMSQIASENRDDVEAQVLYALALLANQPLPTRRTPGRNRQPLCLNRWAESIRSTQASRTT